MHSDDTHQVTAAVFSRDLNLLGVLGQVVRDHGVGTTCINNTTEYNRLIQRERPDIAVVDLDRTEPVFLQNLWLVLAETHCAVILLASFGPVDSADRPLQCQFSLKKPIRLSEFRSAVMKSVQRKVNKLSQGCQENSDIGSRLGIVAVSPQMVILCDVIQKAGDSRSPVLIHGETGTEVDEIARAIHRVSAPNMDSFTTVYCASLPDPQVEGQLFATDSKREVGDSEWPRTIYLHGIEEMPQPLQGKLLRCLGAGRSSGGAAASYPAPRLIASIAKPKELVLAERLVRADVYHLLDFFSICLCPLRDRRQDILPLLKTRYAALIGSGKLMPHYSDEVVRILTSYPWPGNVLELENLAARLSLKVDRTSVELQDLPKAIVSFCDAQNPVGNGDAISPAASDIVPLDVFELAGEQAYIMHVLAMYRDDKERTAAALGISVATLYRKLQDLERSTSLPPNFARVEMPEKPCSLKEFVQRQRGLYLLTVLDTLRNDKCAAAERLGISVATLYRLLPQSP